MIDWLLNHECEIAFKSENLSDGNFIIVSSFTEKYEPEIKRFLVSLKNTESKYIIYRQPDKGEWLKNCHYVPLSILKTLVDFPNKNVLWVDADAEILEYPAYFNDFNCDVGAHKRMNPDGGFHWNSGTLFYRNCPRIVSWLTHQIESLDNYYAGLKDWYHDTNYMLKNAESLGIHLAPIPAKFSIIFDTRQKEEQSIKPVIVHYQASRKHKGDGRTPIGF